MPGEEVGSAYATIGIRIDEAGLNAAKSKLSSSVDGLEGKFKSGFGSGLQSSISGMTASMGPIGSAIDGVAGSLGMAGMATVGAVAGLAMVGSAAVSTAANWESLMASVSKTTGVEGSGLSQLSNDLQQIRMETGATAEEIANAVTVAGSVGIPTDELAAFSEVAMQMGSAFGMSAEAAVEGISAIGNSVKPAEMSWTEFATKAGSSINVLADEMRTSEEKILTGMSHLGATMGLLKPPIETIPQWQALVATIQSLGLSGDSAGEAIQDAMMRAVTDAKGNISSLVGMTKEELQLNMRTNAPEVMQQAASAIKALPLEEQGAALSLFGETGKKAIMLLMGDLDPATGKFDKLGNAIDISNKAFEEGASLASAYGKSQETFNASLDRLGASLDVAGQKLGTLLLPALSTGVDLLTAGVQGAIGFGEALSDMVAGGAAIISELFDPENWMSTPKEFIENLDNAFLTALGIDIGDTVGDAVAEDSDLPKAPGKALGSEEALAKVAESAEDLAKRVSEEMVAGIQSGMSDLDILAMINRQEGGHNAVFDRIFEYAGKSLRMQVSDGVKSDFYSLISGDNIWAGSGQTYGSAVEAFEAITGLPAPEVGTAAYFRLIGNATEAERLEMIENLKSEKQVNIADLIFEPETAIKSKMDELFKSIDSALEDGTLTMGKDSEQTDLLGLVQDLDWLKRYYPDEYAKIGGESIEKLADALRRGDIDAVMQQKGFNAGKKFIDSLTGQILGNEEMRDLADVVASGGAGITDFAKWKESVFLPALESSFEEALDYANNYNEEDLAIASAWIDDKQSLYKAHSNWFEGWQADLLGKNKAGILSDLELMEEWEKKTKEAVDKLEQAKKQLVDGSGRFYGDFMTKAHDWTEYVNEYGGYTGPTEHYDEYYAAQAGQQIRAMEALQNVEDIKVALSVDVETAKQQLQAFYDEQTKDKEKSELEKTLEIDDDQATKDIQTIDTAAKLGVIKPFALDGVDYAMGQIAAIDAAASRPVTKMVYVQEVGGGGGIGSGGSQGTWDPFNWLSFANEGYVRSPTLAVIGDRPGGEYVVGADRFEAAAAKMGNNNNTRGGDVNIYVTVQGSVTGEDLIDQIVEQSKKAVAYDMARGKKW